MAVVVVNPGLVVRTKNKKIGGPVNSFPGIGACLARL